MTNQLVSASCQQSATSSAYENDVPSGRDALDGARGVASLKVMLGHTIGIGEHWSDRGHWWVKYSPLELVLDPRIAVYMFFVLSGCALYAVLDRANNFSYAKFLARRLIRIGLPLFAMCILAFVMVSFAAKFISIVRYIFQR